MSAIDYTKAYITHNNGTSLATIDENNNFVDLGTFVDSGGTALTRVYGLAFGKDGEIYLTQQNGGSNETFSGSDTQIWKANLPAVDGKITLTKIGTGLGLHRNIAIDTHAMDIGPDGSMYILDLSGNIFTVDLSTGLASFVAETVVDGATEDAQISNAMDIVFDANSTLYAQGTHPEGGSRLFTVNASTGAATSVGAFDSGTNIMGLWTNSENTIYATKYSNPGNLYTVNPETAALTLVGNEGDYGNKPHGGDAYIAYSGWSVSTASSISASANTADTPPAPIIFEGDNNGQKIVGNRTDDQLFGLSDNNWIYGEQGDDLIKGRAGNDHLFGGTGHDLLYGGDGIDRVIGNQGRDNLYGNRGGDFLFGWEDNDLIRAGKGPDVVSGGIGADELWGDFGKNTFLSEKDSQSDCLVILSDQFMINQNYGKSGNNPNGNKADLIMELDPIDVIKIHGVSTDQLSFTNTNSNGKSGIGIFAAGYLEAVYLGDDLTLAQIQSMTTGDNSAKAISNTMERYGNW